MNIILKKIALSTLSLFCLVACNPNLDFALEQAGENRAELEKVLEHFKNDPDTLKYSAAKFLIENMPIAGYDKDNKPIPGKRDVAVQQQGSGENECRSDYRGICKAI